jgi:hypothetical protein
VSTPVSKLKSYDHIGRHQAEEQWEGAFYLQPHATSSFKVSSRREFPETNYVKHRIRVVVAKDARMLW